jgi:integrase
MSATKNSPKTCHANVGNRKNPILCGKPIADGMIAACKDHKTVMIKTATSGVFSRGGGYIAVTVRRGNQHKTYHRTYAEATESKSDRTGKDRKPSEARTPFDEYAREWIENFGGRTRRGFDETTRRGYQLAIDRYLIPHFENTPVRDISRKDVRALVRKLERQGLAASSIRSYIAPLRAMFSDAVDDEDLSRNPALRLNVNAKVAQTRQNAATARRDALTETEVVAILEAVPDRWRLLFDTLAGTGCRISEILGLEWDDLATDGETTTLRICRQFYRGTLKPNAKTEAGTRAIDLDPDLAAKLWAVGADSTGIMFTTRTGGRLSDRNLRRVLDDAAERAGVADVSFHDFRHFHGSWLLAEGLSLPDVSARLGHANVKITAEVYSHTLKDRRPTVPSLSNRRAIEDPQTAANASILAGPEIAD